MQGYYRIYLGRDAGVEEAAVWVAQLMGGVTEDQVVVGFVTSAEYAALHPTADGYVRSLYRNILGREGSEAEVAFHTTNLAGGASRADVALFFLRSSEACGRAIDSFYVSLLNREAEVAGRDHWLAVALSRQNYTDVALALLASDEFFQSAT